MCLAKLTGILLVVAGVQIAHAAPLHHGASDWLREHPFKVTDRDDDGFISAEEFEHRMPDKMLAFEPSDIDDDGRLNRDEYDIALAFVARMSGF
jgi:hypothetical protein